MLDTNLILNFLNLIWITILACSVIGLHDNHKGISDEIKKIKTKIGDYFEIDKRQRG